jgi:4-cresol dehydrogenase (hydroxylating)
MTNKVLEVGATHEPLCITLNFETDHSIFAVTNLTFRRDDIEATVRAGRCADELYDLVRKHGLEVYRARQDMMHQITSRDQHHWSLIARLKQTFDPDGVIAPGRYCPVDAGCA